MKPLWDWGFFLGSLTAAFGTMVQELPVVDGRYAGGAFEWVTPFSHSAAEREPAENDVHEMTVIAPFRISTIPKFVTRTITLLRCIIFSGRMSESGQSETPNHVSDGGSFRRKRPW
jgi:hypothetical protein